MSVRITDTRNVALYDSVTGIAFGPIFDTSDDAEAFLLFLEAIGDGDARKLLPAELILRHNMWKDRTHA